MAKFYGQVGFGIDTEVAPGVWEKRVVERSYFGEVVRQTLEVVGGQTVLGDSKTANSFSIVADPYSYDHFMDMEYVKWRGRYWAVRQVELPGRPRLLIRIGGVYNGPVAQGTTPEPPGDDSGD